MDEALLVKKYPILFHMAERGSWPKIKNTGLLSTTALLNLFEISGDIRFKIESQKRPESVQIHHPKYGDAVIRDQKPLSLGIRSFIDGMSLQQYIELLNRKTFFWVRRERLVSLLSARAYRGKVHDVLVVDTRRIVERHGNEITLSPINSGAFRGSGRRGVQTFKKISDYQYAERVKKSPEDPVVELAVEYAVMDIADVTIRVEEWTGSRTLGVVWERDTAD